MYEEKFELIQHTPILHFKPDDIPIRLTELKPAFDRYLIKVLNLKIDEKEFKKNYRYKVFINYKNLRKEKIYTTINSRGKIKKIPKTNLFFGDKERYFFVYSDIEVIFRSFDKNLLKNIKKYFPYFLSEYNFAMRKTKGYGSFTYKNFLKPKKRVFKIVLSISEWDKELSFFYKSLRQGINQSGFYIKPLIFEYACKEGFNWEKKRIKEFLSKNNFYNPKIKHQTISCNNLPYKIVRDVFGLSTFQAWMNYKDLNKNLAKITKDGIYDRFPSPLFFKPIRENNQMSVYFWVKDYEKYIKNKEFVIKCNNKFVDKLKVIDINWDKFFDLMLSKKDAFKINSSNNIEKILAKVYSSLKEI